MIKKYFNYFISNRLVLFGFGQILCYVSFPNQFFHWGWCIIGCFYPLFLLLDSDSFFQRFKQAWIFFQTFFIFLFWMNPFKYHERYESWDMVVINVLFYTLYPILFSLVFSIVCRSRCMQSIIGFPLMWFLFEWGMTVVPFGFPFSLALSVYNIPECIQLAGVGGIQLVSTLLMVLSVSLFFCCHETSKSKLCCLLVLSCCCVGVFYLAYRQSLAEYPVTQAGDGIPIICVQPNIDWHTAYYAYEDNFFFRHINFKLKQLTDLASEGKSSGIFIFPELTISDFNSDNVMIRDTLKSITNNRYGLIIGARDGNHNTILGFDTKSSIISRYHKQQLIPVFERYEPEQGLYFNPIRIESKMPVFGFSLCYELLFPRITKQLVQQGCDVIGALSFNTWLGHNNWPLLHAAYLPFRAVENRKPGIFVNNNGPSLFCDPFGRITHRIGVNSKGYFVVYL